MLVGRGLRRVRSKFILVAGWSKSIISRIRERNRVCYKDRRRFVGIN